MSEFLTAWHILPRGECDSQATTLRRPPVQSCGYGESGNSGYPSWRAPMPSGSSIPKTYLQ